MWMESLPAGPDYKNIAEYMRLVYLSDLDSRTIQLMIYRLEAIRILTIHLKP